MGAIVDSAKQANTKDLLVLGGEPFLNLKNLASFISLIDNENIYITTSLPYTFIARKEECLSILDKITCLNVSIHGVTDEENNKVLRASSHHSRFSVLEYLCKYYAQKVRVNLLLNRAIFNTKEKVMETLEKLAKLGVRKVKISEMQHNEDEYVSFEQLFGIRMKEPYGNCESEISKLFPDLPLEIELKRTCFVLNKNMKCSFREFYLLLKKNLFSRVERNLKVIYENGKINKHW